MAKKRARERQPRLEGADEGVPQEVTVLAHEYCDKLYERMELQKEEDVLRGQVLAAMKEHELTKVDADGWLVTRKPGEPTEDKLKVKRTEPKPAAEADTKTSDETVAEESAEHEPAAV